MQVVHFERLVPARARHEPASPLRRLCGQSTLNLAARPSGKWSLDFAIIIVATVLLFFDSVVTDAEDPTPTSSSFAFFPSSVILAESSTSKLWTLPLLSLIEIFPEPALSTVPSTASAARAAAVARKRRAKNANACAMRR